MCSNRETPLKSIHCVIWINISGEFKYSWSLTGFPRHANKVWSRPITAQINKKKNGPSVEHRVSHCAAHTCPRRRYKRVAWRVSALTKSVSYTFTHSDSFPRLVIRWRRKVITSASHTSSAEVSMQTCRQEVAAPPITPAAWTSYSGVFCLRRCCVTEGKRQVSFRITETLLKLV